jgi:transposase-like protein
VRTGDSIGRRIIRKGVRRNKYGDVQLFYCRHCKKKFTPLVNKHKSFFAPSAESVGTKLAQIAEDRTRG